MSYFEPEMHEPRDEDDGWRMHPLNNPDPNQHPGQEEAGLWGVIFWLFVIFGSVSLFRWLGWA